MNRILLFCALGVLLGCRPTAEPSGEVITLSYSTSSESKTDALTVGDEVAVYARLEGTEQFFLEAAKFITGADGQTLSTSPVAYYPETKQAVEFFAYFPYHTGVFSVPNDQSTAVALKQADLCWATTKSTPISVVPLTFQHLFARLVVQTNEPTSKIVIPTASPSGVLNAATAEFVLGSNKNEVFTTGNELILPVQPLNRLVLTVSGIEYSFEGSVGLEAGKTTTLNLTLNSSTKTATLNGSSTTDWTASHQQGNATQAVSNILTLHWANYVPQGATPDKIVLTINGTDYTVSSGITYANKTFTVPFASEKLRYPYTISKITFSGIPLACTQLLGEMVYKSGSSTIGIKDIPNAVLIDRGGYKLWWAIGNLVADGANGCKIGASTDCGLYFQFGSLIGWRGGSNGDGTGSPMNLGSPQIAVKPSSYTGGSAWGSVGMYSAIGTSGTTSHFSNQQGGANSAATGIGDACSFYLGNGWRMPTAQEVVSSLLNGVTNGSFSGTGWSQQASPVGAVHSSPYCFLPICGSIHSQGYYQLLGSWGGYRSASIWGATDSYGMVNNGGGSLTILQYAMGRADGVVIRCCYP